MPEIGVRINLTEPVDATEEYDKILSMFDWELAEQVELSQGEFNEYVLDETPNIMQAKYQNSFYTSISKGK